MKIHKSTYQQMNELFKDAQHEKPLMSIKEVEKIVSTGNYLPKSGVRGFHVGMNTIIVVSGILISSLLTYFTLKEDHQKIELPKDVVANNSGIQLDPDQNASAYHSEPSTITNRDATAPPTITKADKERPAVNTEHLLASRDNAIINDNSETAIVGLMSENEMTPTVENVKVSPMNTKNLYSEFTIRFPYVNDSVTMKVNDDEIVLLSINNKIIPAEDYSDYEDIIADGRNYLAGKKAENEQKYSLDLITFFDKQLRSDKILLDNSQYLFELTSSRLFINKDVQDDSIFRKYKRMYLEKTGKVITRGSVYKFEMETKPE